MTLSNSTWSPQYKVSKWLLLFSCKVLSDSLATPWLLNPMRKHTSLLCPPLSPRVWSDSCPLSWWCYPIISAAPFFCLQSFPASGSFQMSQFASCSQIIGASASASIHPIFRADSFRIDWFDLLAAQGTLKSLFQHHNLKTSILHGSAFFMV